MPNFLLDILLLVTMGSMAMVTSTRYQTFGPDGAVGLWLVGVPPLVLMSVALMSMLLSGRFDWVPGGRAVSLALLTGVFISLSVSLWFVMDPSDGMWDRLVMLAPWLMVAGCFIAVHAGAIPQGLARTAISATLGVSGVAGWALVASGMMMYADHQNEREQARREHEVEWQRQRSEEFRALGQDAELWHYFGHMFSEDEAVRSECRAILASRPNLNEKLAEYLTIETLYTSAVLYIGRVQENPPASLAPAYARFLEARLSGYREVLDDSSTPWDRKDDLRPFFLAAARIQKAGGNLRPQLTAWRDYLRTLKNMNDLADDVEQALRSQP